MRESDFQIPWQEWIASFGPRFLLFARQQTRSESDAADVLQDSLLELWQRTGGTPPDPPLVFATVRRRAVDLARKNQSRNAREKEWAADSGTNSGGEFGAQTPVSPWFECGQQEEDQKIAAALRAIRPGFAEVVVLKIWGNLTFEQIATTLGINPSAAASRYRYGVESLRLHLNSAPVL